MKILKLACFVLLVRNREGHFQVQNVGGGQGELFTGTIATELVNLNGTKTITARIAKHVEQQNVMEMQCAGAAKQAEEQKKKDPEIILNDGIHIPSWL